jgi:hypothetical protein
MRTYPREVMTCTTCNNIVCKKCFDSRLKGYDWKQAQKDKQSWSCPACMGNCVCNRCRKHTKRALPSYSPSHRFYESPRKEDTYFYYDDERSEEEAEVSKPMSETFELQLQGETKLQEEEVARDASVSTQLGAENSLLWKNTPYAGTLEELYQRQKSCQDFIEKTQTLLKMITREKQSIGKEITELLTAAQSHLATVEHP